MDKDIRRVSQSCRQLLGFGGWMVKDEKGGANGFEANEEKKLELRLGPPVENWPEANVPREKEHSFDSVIFLNCFSAGTKRGLSNGMKPKIEAFEQQKQPCFLHLQTKPGFEKEIFQRTNGTPEQQQSIEVKGCCLPPPQSANAAGSAAVGHSRSQTRSSSTPVVGWPPIRSFRKNLASTSKQALGSQLGSAERAGKSESSSKSLFVKINMEGIPIGRKVDLRAYESYEKLSLVVNELFWDLLSAQMDPLNANKKNTEKQGMSGLLDESGEYILIYEDDEGDRMLVGDVPWDMFVATAKRLRVLKSSELTSSSSSMGTFNWKRNPT